MSSPKFMVFKLKDLQIPIIMLLVALAVFSFFMLTSNKADATESFSPNSTYEDGMYVASIALTDADIDVIVNVKDNQITSVALDGFDDTEKAIYQDFDKSISFINDYVTATQSLELPKTETLSVSSGILMDAVRIALSDDQEASITTSYETPVVENISEDGQSTDQAVVSEDNTASEDAADQNTDEVVSEDATTETAPETDAAAPQN
ncbi:MAG: hypothetical protein ACRCW2_12290 [Cellulosilyticaceae bacterium]